MLRSGLDTCFCVAALGVTSVPAAGPEVSPCAGPTAMAIGAQNDNIDCIPPDRCALTAIALIRCLPLFGPRTQRPGRGSYWIGYLIRKFRRLLLLRYSEAMHAQAMQTAACIGRHNLEQRLARWLLIAHDRSDGDVLPLTQKCLSLMLCVYQPSITTAAGLLQRAGIITYGNSRRGSIIILDREALEDTTCDCYEVVQDRFNQRV